VQVAIKGRAAACQRELGSDQPRGDEATNAWIACQSVHTHTHTRRVSHWTCRFDARTYGPDRHVSEKAASKPHCVLFAVKSDLKLSRPFHVVFRGYSTCAFFFLSWQLHGRHSWQTVWRPVRRHHTGPPAGAASPEELPAWEQPLRRNILCGSSLS
jgi:hypothetical protein